MEQHGQVSSCESHVGVEALLMIGPSPFLPKLFTSLFSLGKGEGAAFLLIYFLYFF